MSDMAKRLRQTRSNMLGTEDEEHYWDCHEAAKHIEELEKALLEAQAKIDRLMLEYCPNEMTPDQLENWAKHQRPTKQEVPEIARGEK